jgi:hypothetical protein
MGCKHVVGLLWFYFQACLEFGQLRNEVEDANLVMCTSMRLCCVVVKHAALQRLWGGQLGQNKGSTRIPGNRGAFENQSNVDQANVVEVIYQRSRWLANRM